MSPTERKRPAAVISSDAYNQAKPDLIIIAVTSQVKPTSSFGEVTVRDWQGAGLLKPSVIKPVITTIEKSFVL
ncbi:MAG: type II toxin-antitoxin system PemK/MazF family toxin [Chromatiales bacterium]